MLTDPFAEDWLDVLRQRFLALPPARRLHLLIDGGFVPGLHRRIDTGRKTLLFAGLPGSDTRTLDVSPFVIPFDPNDRSVRTVLRRCEGWPMVSLIETSEPWQVLAARLAAWCVIEADGQRFNFRFADTRRLPVILKTLDPAQRWQLAGQAVGWSYIGRDGAWRTLGLDGTGGAIATDPRLNDAQFGALVEDGLADEILARLGTSTGRVPSLPSQAYAIICAALNSAAGAGMSDADLVNWCEWVWTHGTQGDGAHMPALFDQWKTRPQFEGVSQ